MKIFKRLSVLCLALLMVTCCGLLFGCNKKDYNKIELNEVTHSIFYAPLYVAMNNGYFEDEGLTVSLTNGGGSNTSMSALLSGSADMILAGPETAVYTNQEGVSNAPVVFGQLTQCDGSFIVSKEADADFTLADLVGETIIGGRAGGLPAMTLQYIIETSGYTIGTGADEINLRTDVAFDLTASVWENDSTVKYCTLFEPTATNITNAVAGSEIVASLGELSGTIPYTCFIARENYIDEHGDVVEKFLTAVKRGYNYIVTNIENDSSYAVAQALLPSFDGNTISELQVAVEQYVAINAWSATMSMTSESFDRLLSVMLNADVITEKSPFSEVVDNTYVENLLEESVA